MSLAITSPRSPVASLLARRALRLSETTSVRDAARAMRAAGVSSALVGHGHAIVTERDLTAAWASGLAGEEDVFTIATFEPVIIGAGTTILEAASLMLNQEVRHLVVQMEDGSASVVSLRDVMAALLQAVNPETWLATLRLTVTPSTDLWLG